MAPAAGDAILRAVEQSPLAVAMRGELWLYPAVETLHICGFVTLVGAAIMFDMRLFGLSRGLSVRGLAWHLLPWSVAALLVIVPTGLLMFSAHAGEFVDNLKAAPHQGGVAADQHFSGRYFKMHHRETGRVVKHLHESLLCLPDHHMG